MLLILIDSAVAQANGIQLSHLQLAKIIDQLRAHDCALSHMIAHKTFCEISFSRA